MPPNLSRKPNASSPKWWKTSSQQWRSHAAPSELTHCLLERLGARDRGGPRLLHIYWGKKCIRDWAEPGCTPWGGCQPTDVVGGSRWQVSKCRGRRRPLTWWTWPRTYGPATMAWVKLSVLCLGRSPAELAARPRVGRCSSDVYFYSTAGCPRGPACCAACSGTGRV